MELGLCFEISALFKLDSSKVKQSWGKTQDNLGFVIFLLPHWENQRKFKIAFLCHEITRGLSLSTLITIQSNKLKIACLGHRWGTPLSRISFGHEWWDCHQFITVSYWEDQGQTISTSKKSKYLIIFPSFGLIFNYPHCLLCMEYIFVFIFVGFCLFVCFWVLAFPSDLG